MRIYYFGELIEDNGVKVTNSAEQKTEILEQTQMELTAPVPTRKSSMESIGDLLKEIDMNLDSLRQNRQRSMQY